MVLKCSDFELLRQQNVGSETIVFYGSLVLSCLVLKRWEQSTVN